jgi:hypothetical protein
VNRSDKRYPIFKIKHPPLTSPVVFEAAHQKRFLNKSLPEEIINLILGYLSPSDTLNLACSRLFLPGLLHCPKFFEKLRLGIFHAIVTSIGLNADLFAMCALIPMLIDGQLLFSIDLVKFDFFFKIYNGSYSLFPGLLNAFLLPAKLTVAHPDQPLEQLLKNLPPCSASCVCHRHHYSFKKT